MTHLFSLSMQMSRVESSALVLFSAPPHSVICLDIFREFSRGFKFRTASHLFATVNNHNSQRRELQPALMNHWTVLLA